MAHFNIHEAKTQFSKLINDALAGQEIIIAKADLPLVKLVPIQIEKTKRIGAFKGKIKISNDFDAPLPDEILKGFYGE